jgi:plastocyanin
MRHLFVLLGIAALLSFVPAALHAQDYTVTIKDHKFTPAEIKVPANKRVEITVINDDATPEEFESKPMKVEKVIPGKSKGVVRIGPLKAGRYPFVGEFHESTAKGTVIAE